jgi:hypothetical protein
MPSCLKSLMFLPDLEVCNWTHEQKPALMVTAFKTRSSKAPRDVFWAMTVPQGMQALVTCGVFLFFSFYGSGSFFRTRK